MKKIITFVSILVLFLAIPAMAADQGNIDNSTGVGVVGGQGQGQGQGQSINTVDDSVVEAQERAYPVPGGVGYGPVINYFGKPLPTAGFRPVESLLLYGNIFSEGALESIVAHGNRIIHELKIVRGEQCQVRAKYEEGEVRWIQILATAKKLKGYGLIGYATSEADNRKTTMIEVMAQAALDALRAGADTLQIVAQGASRDTETSGWGIGFNTTQATMMSGAKGPGGANISSGGTGYSAAWAGMRDKPWIQCNALKAPNKVLGTIGPDKAASADKEVKPVLAKPATAVKKEVKEEVVVQTGNHKSSSQSN